MKDKLEAIRSGNFQLSEGASAFIGQIIALAVGFILPHASVLDGYIPFGISLVAGINCRYCIAAGVGAAVGYLMPLGSMSSFRYIAAVLAVVGIRQLMPQKMRLVKSSVFAPLIALLATAACVALPSVLVKEGGWGWLIECLLAACGSYFVHRACDCISHIGDGKHATEQEMASTVIMIGLMLTALGGISIAGVHLTGVLAALIVLYAAQFGHESGGAVAGISVGFVLSLADSGRLYLAGAYSLGGLLGGVTASFGPVFSAVSLIMSVSVFLLRADPTAFLPALYEMAAASVLFILTPQRLSGRLAELFAPPTEMPRLDGLRKTVSMRLGFASDALGDVAATVGRVAERLSSINTPKYEEIFTLVEREVCSHCPLCANCWQNERAATLSQLIDLTKQICGGASSDELPQLYQKSECSRADVVCNSLERHFKDYDSHRVAQQRIDEVRSVMADQFIGMSDMLGEMAVEFERSQKYDEQTAETVSTVLAKMGYTAADVACSVDCYERMTLEIRLDRSAGRRINKIEMIKELSVACGRDFSPPCINAAEKYTLITLSERPALSVEYGFCQYCCSPSQMCGDTGDYVEDGRGHGVALLSDGMGTGGRAAVDSAMVTGLLKRLVMAGFGYDCSLKIINSAMLFKSTDESLATVDIASLDLYTGRLNMYKAGACATVIRRGRRVGKAESSSLPVGILREVGFDCAEVRLAAGDIVVMMSDGVSVDGVDWVCDLVNNWGIGTAQQLADRIVADARRRRTDGHEDDITAMVMLISERK